MKNRFLTLVAIMTSLMLGGCYYTSMKQNVISGEEHISPNKLFTDNIRMFSSESGDSVLLIYGADAKTVSFKHGSVDKNGKIEYEKPVNAEIFHVSGMISNIYIAVEHFKTKDSGELKYIYYPFILFDSKHITRIYPVNSSGDEEKLAINSKQELVDAIPQGSREFYIFEKDIM